MEEKTRYTLGQGERLKSRKLIDELFTNGKSVSVFPFRFVYKKQVNPVEMIPANRTRKPAGLQAAFSVSKRNFKKATDRNRIKRLIREAWRLQKNELQAWLQQNNQQAVVFILYTGKELPDYATVAERIKKALLKLQKMMNEETAQDM